MRRGVVPARHIRWRMRLVDILAQRGARPITEFIRRARPSAVTAVRLPVGGICFPPGQPQKKEPHAGRAGAELRSHLHRRARGQIAAHGDDLCIALPLVGCPRRHHARDHGRPPHLCRGRPLPGSRATDPSAGHRRGRRVRVLRAVDAARRPPLRGRGHPGPTHERAGVLRGHLGVPAGRARRQDDARDHHPGS